MSQTENAPIDAQNAATEVPQEAAYGLASFVDAETREIMNLLNQDTDASGGCCGGSCCS